MPEIVRAALVQQAWAGDKDSVVAAAAAHIATAASAGAKVGILQELFYGPYFCQVQDADYYGYTEAIPDGPTTRLMQDLAQQPHIVIIAPMYEEEQPGLYYNTAAVIDADGRYIGKYRKNHLPQVKGFWEKFYFRRGNLGYPIFDPPSAGSASISATTGTSRRAGGRSAWPARGSCSIPRRLHAGSRLTCGTWSSPPPRSPTSTTSARSTGSGSSRWATTTSTASPTSSTPRPARRRGRLRQRRRGGGARPRHGPADRGQGPVAVLPGPPADWYESLVNP